MLGEACLEEGAEVGTARTEDTLVGRHGDLERTGCEKGERRRRGGERRRREGVRERKVHCMRR